jgi:hypothetical protein
MSLSQYGPVHRTGVRGGQVELQGKVGEFNANPGSRSESRIGRSSGNGLKTA